jgi:hypothetical protein
MTPYNEALDGAISRSRRKMFIFASVVTLVEAVFIGVLLTVVSVPATVLAWLALPVFVWFIYFRGDGVTRALRGLRGAVPSSWLPSPSHGIVILTDTVLLGGGLPYAELNRHGSIRVESVSVPDSPNAIMVAISHTSSDGSHGSDKVARHLISLDSDVSAERIDAFAKAALERSRR